MAADTSGFVLAHADFDGPSYGLSRVGPDGAPAYWHDFQLTKAPPGPLRVAVLPAGATVFAGALAEAVDFGGGPLSSQGSAGFQVRLDASGHHISSAAFGAGAIREVAGVASDASGDVAFAGSFAGTLDLGQGPMTPKDQSADAFLARVDPTGTFLLAKAFGGPSDACVAVGMGCDQLAMALGADAAGNLHLLGSYEGSLDVGLGNMNNPSGGDGFLARFTPAGKPAWSIQPPSRRLSAMAVEAHGNALVGGTGMGVASPPPAIAIDHRDPDGKQTFGATFRSQGNATLMGLALDGAGNMAPSGTFVSAASFHVGGGL